MEVAVPNSLLNLLLFHWLKILYLFEVLLIAGSVLLSSPEVQNFGWKALGITLAVHIVVVLLRDYMQLRHKWQRILTFAFAAVLLLLAITGVVRLYALGLSGIVAELSKFAQNIWTALSKP